MPPKKASGSAVAKVVQKRKPRDKWTDEEAMTLLEQIIIHKVFVTNKFEKSQFKKNHFCSLRIKSRVRGVP